MRFAAVFISVTLCSITWLGCHFTNGQTAFIDITEQAGISHQFVVYEGMFGGGATVFDLNKDGYEDVFITGGMNDDVLYLNNGDGSFVDIFDQSGLDTARFFVTQGAASADVNKDGWVDLFVTTVTTKDSLKKIPRAINLLFLNNGNNTFTNVTKRYKLDQLNSFSTGASFGDIDADGFADLYVGNYFLNYEGELTYISDATIVNSNSTSKGYLLKNSGGKYFTDVYEEYGLDYKGFGFGGVFTDYDNDSDQDLLVIHDFGFKATPNMLLENKYPNDLLKNVAKPLDMDLKINAMSAAVGDINNDGYMDYYITNIRFNHMMMSQGAENPYSNELKKRGLSYSSISWGANFADFDNDGDLDLFVANGDLNPNCAPMINFYFENHKGIFSEKARVKGVGDYGLGRGSVVFDIENDGDLDILVVNQKAVLDYPVPSTTRLYRNDSADGNWIKIALEGINAESHGLGSRIEIVSGDTRMIREIDGGSSSHLSQNSTISHFGLGSITLLDTVMVKWTGGKQQILINQKVNTLLTIVESEDANYTPFYLIGFILILIILFSFYRVFKSSNRNLS